MNREQALEAALREIDRHAGDYQRAQIRTVARVALDLPPDRPSAKLAALERVAVLAGAIAIETPRRQKWTSHSAYVPWQLILDLRAALTVAGYDLEAARAVYEETKRQARKGDAP